MIPLIHHANRIVTVGQFRIVEAALAETFLSADEAAGQTAISVKDIAGFAVAKYAWINPFGPNSEIIAMHASTDPASGAITLAAATAFAHFAGEKIYYVEFNQVEITHAATLTGSKSVLSTEGLIARERELTYLDVSQTTGFYFARFKDSVAATFGGYSDGVDYDGWDSDTVGHLIRRSLRDLNTDFSKNCTLEDCIDWAAEGMAEIQAKQRRWPEHMVYDEILGQTVRGVFELAMPTLIYDKETNRSILEIRLGDGAALQYLDPHIFDTQMGDAKRTEVRTEASAADTALAVDNSFDFAESGTLTVYVAGVKYEITYTGVTFDDVDGGTAVFSGIPASGDGSISVTIPVDTNIWQDESEGTPTWYTVRNSQLEYWPLPNQEQDNENIYGDYSKIVTEINSQGDTIDYQFYRMLQPYVTWRIEAVKKNNGKLEMDSSYHTMYLSRVSDAIRFSPTPKTKTGPNINRMMRKRRGFRAKPDVQNLSVDEQ